MLCRASFASGKSLFPTTKRLLSTVEVRLAPGWFVGHNLERTPADVAVTSKEEFMEYFKLMHTMRRMEITCHNEYLARNIRGFCHLYNGQEAVGTGIQAGLSLEDSWITSYRCHCIMLARGGTLEGIFAELMGKGDGHTGGKGGSMHFYNKSQNFYGGQGIVGAQVPVGTGLAFANKYNTPPGEKMPVAIACYGDGAANQGQIAESANMAMLWKLPMIFCVENNRYGMGTSSERSSSNTKYFTMGNVIPGLKVDGMNVLAVREGVKFAKEHAASGKGPIFLELETYRYMGHSASDPANYRPKAEGKAILNENDPIVVHAKNALVRHFGVTEEEVKAITNQIKTDVLAACERAKALPAPHIDTFADHVYIDGRPDFVRMPAIQDSIVAAAAAN